MAAEKSGSQHGAGRSQPGANHQGRQQARREETFPSAASIEQAPTQADVPGRTAHDAEEGNKRVGEEIGNHRDLDRGRFAILEAVVRDELESVAPAVAVGWAIAECVRPAAQFAELRVADDPVLQRVSVGVRGGKAERPLARIESVRVVVRQPSGVDSA